MSTNNRHESFRERVNLGTTVSSAHRRPFHLSLPSGAAMTAVLDIKGGVPTAAIFPDTVTATAFAVYGSVDGDNHHLVHRPDATPYIIYVPPGGGLVALDPRWLLGFRFIRIEGVTVEDGEITGSVTQSGDTDCQLVTLP